MAELERALVKAGYRVASWNVIHQMEATKRLTALEAGKELGAEVLLQVNSLERSIISRGHDEQWHRTFYESNRKGDRGSIADVPEERARAMENGVRENEVAAQPRSQISVTLNVTAVLVASGAAIWFYESTHSEDYSLSARTAQLFQCNRKRLHHCPKRYVRGERRPYASGSRSEGSGTSYNPARKADAGEVTEPPQTRPPGMLGFRPARGRRAEGERRRRSRNISNGSVSPNLAQSKRQSRNDEQLPRDSSGRLTPTYRSSG